MSPEVLRAVNDEIAAEAAQHGRVPYVPFDATKPERWPPFPFPSLGSYVPPGWALAEENWFIDKTGRGRPSELAMTAGEFRTLLIERHGFIRSYENPITDCAFAFENSGKLVSRQRAAIAQLAMRPNAAVGDA